jgi:hypothetical protein
LEWGFLLDSLLALVFLLSKNSFKGKNMSFPEIYKTKINVGKYISDDIVNSFLTRLQKRIDRFLAPSRQGLETFQVNRDSKSYTVEDGTITLSLVRTIDITLPIGTTTEEFNNIRQTTNDIEDSFINIGRTEGILDQEQIVLPSTDPFPPVGDVYAVAEWEGRWYGIWFNYPTAPSMQNLPVAQTFTADKTGKLAKIVLCWGSLNITGSLTIQIQTTDIQGKPTGVVLETLVVPAEDIVWAGTVNHYLSGNTHVVSGTKYAIVIDSINISGNNDSYGFFWALVLYYGKPSITDYYSNGEMLIYNNGTWATTKNSDYIIPTYTLSEPPPAGWNSFIPPINQDAWYNTDNIDLYFQTYVVED